MRSSTLGPTAESAAPQIRRQSTQSRTRFKGLLPHQSFDPMQPARYPFGEQTRATAWRHRFDHR